MTEYLFVYGTLLKGESQNSRLNGCILEEYLSIPGELYDTGYGFPAAYLNGDQESVIFGELYRLPRESASFIELLDSYEDIPNGIFERNTIKVNTESCYIYSLKDPRIPGNFFKIKPGSWLRYCSYIKNDPVTFALNFENAHKRYYRYITESSIITVPGTGGILVSAPHATNHIRLKKYKIFERYTAAVAVLMHSVLDTSSVYTNSVSMTDPNYYDESEFKRSLAEIAGVKKLDFVLDIHGTGEEREEDIYPGVGDSGEFLLGKDQIIDFLYKSADEYGLKCGSLGKFPAAKQQTVTKYCALNLGVPSMQLEINRKYRMPEKHPENFITLINFLKNFLSKIKTRNE